MQLPLRCKNGHETMVEMEAMEKRQISKLVQAEGFRCASCGVWTDYFFVTLSLSEQIKKLSKMSVTHRNYAFHFAKAVRKAAGIQQRKSWLDQK